MTPPRSPSAQGQARFGIEEEFVLLDEQTLAPLAQGTGERERITEGDDSPPASASVGRGEIVAEYLTCQVECITAPSQTRDDAAEQLRRMRRLVSTHAERQGALLAPAGTPFVSSGGFAVSKSPHYDVVSAHLAEITREHEVNGLHVHIEITDEDERVRALVRLRAWLPVLLALTGNSPFARGRHSGFESWRSILIRRLPSSWCPPAFRDPGDYRATIDRLVEIGAIPDASSLAWAVRLSERYPTVEVRVFDTQLHPDDALLATLLTRALIASDLPCCEATVDAVDAALWTAARHGMNARVLDPLGDGIAPVQDVTATMLERLRPVLADAGDEDFVVAHLDRLRVDGTGAQRQARAYRRGGVDGLRALYAAQSPS